MRLVFLFSCFLFVSYIQSQSVTVEISHWIYPYLNRLESKGLVPGLKNGTLPMSRETIASFLTELDSQIQINPSILSKIENELFERAKGEFRDELEENINIQKSEHEPHIYTWKKNDGHVHFDLLIGDDLTYQNPSSSKVKQIQHAYYGGILRGSWKGIGFYSNNQIHSEWGGGPYQQHYSASDGYPQSLQSDSSGIVWDLSVSSLRFTIKGIDVTIGRDRVQWGPSLSGNLMLNGSVYPMDMVRLSTNIGAARFTWLHGQLMSGDYLKWISAHRLEISVSQYLDLGVNESLIYGNRNVELAYLNPLLPYLIAEHTLGDRDNLAMGLDFDFHRVRNLKIYGEFFIDDLFAPWDVFSDFWGNRLAFLTGIHWIDPAGFKNSELTLQYSRIEPYVYTHEDSINTYEHFGEGLGSPLQPNSDAWQIQFKKWMHRNIQLELGANISRHGEGNRKRPHTDLDGDKKVFLSGIVEQKTSGYVKCILQPKRDLFGHFYIARKLYQNFENINDNDQDLWEIGLGLHVNW